MKKKSILSQFQWWTVNKSITRELGIDASILLSDLLWRQEYWEDHGGIDDYGFFFIKRDEIEQATTLSLHRQNKALSILKDRGILKYKNSGVPPKTRFKIDIKYLNDFTNSLYDPLEEM